MSDPKLSIIIPCHNTGKYITRLLDSLSSQEWNFRSKRELIFVLDNCSDNTEELIKQYNLSSKGYEVQIIPANVNSAGLSRNIGLDNSYQTALMPFSLKLNRMLIRKVYSAQVRFGCKYLLKK